MSATDSVRGTVEESVRAAKAAFAKVDPERLKRFLESQAAVAGPVSIGPITYPSDGAGSSNGIGFFSATLDRGAGVETLELVLRYSPGVQLLKQKSYAAEFKTLRAIEGSGLPAPRALWLDADGGLLGCAGYVMSRVQGETPSAAMYSRGPLANLPPRERKRRMLAAASFHGRLRKAAIGPDKVPHLGERGNGETAIEREVNWWYTEVLLAIGENDPKAHLIRSVRDWLVAHQPRDLYPENLVHGDAQIANMIYADGEIAAVVDWELSYLGYNESDLALICFLTEAQKIIDIPVDGTPTEDEYVKAYESSSGGPVRHWPFFKLHNTYRIIAVTSLSARFMPSFEEVWQFHLGYMQAAWDEAKAVYGA